MAVSVTDIETMDRDELADAVRDLSATVDQMETVLHRDIEARKELDDTVAALSERVESLEAENERLRARLDDSGGKDAKVGKIVRYADNARGEQPAVKLTAKEIKGATGCSLRYAYDLMDDLPEEYDWFLTPQEMTQYGSIQIDNTDDRRLGVDFEGVHSAGCPLNLFNNGSTDTGGSA